MGLAGQAARLRHHPPKPIYQALYLWPADLLPCTRKLYLCVSVPSGKLKNTPKNPMSESPSPKNLAESVGQDAGMGAFAG